MLKSISRGRQCTRAMAAQLFTISSFMRDRRGAVGQLLQHKPNTWHWRVVGAGHLSMQDSYAAASLVQWAAEARSEAALSGRTAAQEAGKGWKQWVYEQLRLRAGALHQLSKREDVVAAAAVASEFGPSLGLQQVLDSDCKAWSQIWQRFKEDAGAMRLDSASQLCSDLPWAAPLSDITAAQIIECSRTFKRRTGLGTDSMHPRWFGWLSEALLRAFLAPPMALEVSECASPL